MKPKYYIITRDRTQRVVVVARQPAPHSAESALNACQLLSTEIPSLACGARRRAMLGPGEARGSVSDSSSHESPAVVEKGRAWSKAIKFDILLNYSKKLSIVHLKFKIMTS